MALTSGLTAYWTLNESSGNAADVSGGGFTLTNTNSVTYAAALINNGADFGTTESHNKELFNATQVGLTSGGDWTFSFWIKSRKNLTVGEQFIITSQSNGGLYGQASYDPNGGSPRLRWTVGGNYVNYTVTLGTTDWYHIVLTKTGSSSMEMWVNAVSRGTNTPGGGTSGSTYTNFGASHGASNGCPMYIDEAGVWSRVLTSTEISQLYNNGIGLTYPFTNGSFFPFFF